MKTSMTKASRDNLKTIALLVLAFAVVQALRAGGVVNAHMDGMLVPLCVYATMAVSLNLVVGILGELSLGHAGFMCVGAFSSAFFSKIFEQSMGTFPRFLLAILIGGIVAGIFGFLIGIPVLRLNGDYLAIVTLAFGEIIKNLKRFEDHNEATFIFEVIATRSQTDETVVYHDYVSLVFDKYGEGRKSAIIDKLPVGAYVTVKEIYSGKVYNVDTDKTGGPITAEQITQVEFTNEYEEHHNGGGSVTNHFIYDGRQNKWGWYQMTDSSTEGEVIQSSEKNE